MDNKPKLIMCRGLPGSGKSYWAATQDAVVVTKSDIREEWGLPCDFGDNMEPMVIDEARYRIAQSLKEGKTVISADMNLSAKNESDLRNLADKYGVEFEVKEFDTPLEVCIERDSKRDDYHRAGKKRIMEYHDKRTRSTSRSHKK